MRYTYGPGGIITGVCLVILILVFLRVFGVL